MNNEEHLTYTYSKESLVHFQCFTCKKGWHIWDAPERAYWFCPWCGIKLNNPNAADWLYIIAVGEYYYFGHYDVSFKGEVPQPGYWQYCITRDLYYLCTLKGYDFNFIKMIYCDNVLAAKQDLDKFIIEDGLAYLGPEDIKWPNSITGYKNEKFITEGWLNV